MTLTQMAGMFANEGGDRPRYLPILKSRQGEMNALAHLDDPSPEPLNDVRPIIELVEVELDGATSSARDQELDKLTAKVVKAWPPGRSPVIVDIGSIEVDTTPAMAMHADDATQEPVTPLLLQQLSMAGVRAMPVVRLSDQDAVVDSLSGDLHHGACLRVTAEDLDDTVVPLEDAVSDKLNAYGLDPSRVDLVLDFGTLIDEDALAMASRLAKFVLPSLRGLGWRTFAVGAGAFPVDLSGVQPGSVAKIRRLDRDLWHRLQPFGPPGMAYADYAVTHPRLQTGVAFAAPPQLRYTVREQWLVSKGRRNDRRGHRQFFDICERIRASAGPDQVLPPGLSWGDDAFHTAANKADSADAEGMGNASTWRSIATSHHIAQVRVQMNARHEP